MLFHVVDDAQIILRTRGIYRQAKVYRRGDELFAGYGSGFIKLMGNGGTSIPHATWLHVEGVNYVKSATGQPLFPPAVRSIASR